MSRLKRIQRNFVLIMVLLMSQTLVSGEDGVRPAITGGMPFFYYKDLQAAADWYENQLGLKRVADKDWVVIFELTPSSFIGLVNASDGSLIPTEDKGALLSILAEDLEGWWDYLKDKPEIDMIHGIEEGAAGMIDEFRMNDPEGYVIEFFRWKIAYEDRFDHHIDSQ